MCRFNVAIGMGRPWSVASTESVKLMINAAMGIVVVAYDAGLGHDLRGLRAVTAAGV